MPAHVIDKPFTGQFELLPSPADLINQNYGVLERRDLPNLEFDPDERIGALALWSRIGLALSPDLPDTTITDPPLRVGQFYNQDAKPTALMRGLHVRENVWSRMPIQEREAATLITAREGTANIHLIGSTGRNTAIPVGIAHFALLKQIMGPAPAAAELAAGIKDEISYSYTNEQSYKLIDIRAGLQIAEAMSERQSLLAMLDADLKAKRWALGRIHMSLNEPYAEYYTAEELDSDRVIAEQAIQDMASASALVLRFKPDRSRGLQRAIVSNLTRRNPATSRYRADYFPKSYIELASKRINAIRIKINQFYNACEDAKLLQDIEN